MNTITVNQSDIESDSDGHAGLVPTDIQQLRRLVEEVVSNVPVVDLHTHLFARQFGELNLWGIDEMLTYHYLVAELFRFSKTTPSEFWKLEKGAQADLIWRELFVQNTPLSEAARGVIYVLDALGLDTQAKTLDEARDFFASQDPDAYVDRVLKISKVSDVVMTNDPLDTAEMEVWDAGRQLDPRFHAALRLDRLLNGWADAVPLIKGQGYKVSVELDDLCVAEARRFLDDWVTKMNPLYIGASLPDDFGYPESGPRGVLLDRVILPTCREQNLSLALMIGVRRRVNPELKLAGDGVGRADVSALARICSDNPEVKFLST
ncbi:MAG: glucuronate isomerase, partial [Acidobacteriota bacterium]